MTSSDYVSVRNYLADLESLKVAVVAHSMKIVTVP